MIMPSKLIRDLGVMVDDILTLTAHVNHLSSSCFYQLCQLRAIRRALSTDTAHALVRAWSIVDSIIATECSTECRNTTLIGYSRCYDRLLVTLRLLSSASVTDLMRHHLHWLPICTNCACRHTNACTALSRRIWQNCVFLWLPFLDICS